MKKQCNSFFQIIHALIIQNQELGIPRRFVRKYAKDLSDVVVLEDPNGKVWNVILKRSIDGEVFFKNGWQDFAQHHRIRNGYFLVVRYHGNSVFYVRIYDITGCEIEYVSDNNRSKKRDEGTSHQPNSQPVSQGNGRLGTNGSGKFKQEEVGMSGGRAIHAAGQFRSENPSCVVNVRSSYVNGPWMYLPYRFMETYAKKVDYITLVVSDNGSEKVWRCYLLWYNHTRLVMVYYGWKVFVAETNLKDGDVCVFELMNAEDNVFKVYIFRD